MLVLSRRPTETIVFPPTGITVQVLDVRGISVKMGVAAPADVKILRGEVHDRDPSASLARYPVSPGLRDDLERLSVLLHLCQGQRELGETAAAEATFAQALAVVAELRQGVAPVNGTGPCSPLAAVGS